MSQRTSTRKRGKDTRDNGQGSDLRDSRMMSHLLDALEKGTDIGHYGRLTFVMVARHFMSEDEIVKLVGKQPDHTEEEARALYNQVQAHDYNPPKRERILEWQSQQDFPICPDSDDPAACNVYGELRFPENIYENINDFYEEHAQEK